MTLEPADIRDHWHRIEPVLREHFHGGDPAAIRRACEHGIAWLYVADDGFVVLAPEINTDTGSSELLVWFVHGSAGVIRRYQAELINIARIKGFTTLTTRIARDGLTKALPRLGWKPRYIEYALEIDHG